MLREYNSGSKSILFQKFNGIIHLRSILKIFCDNPDSIAWVDEENGTIAIQLGNMVFLDWTMDDNHSEIMKKLPTTCYIIPTQTNHNTEWGEIFKKRWNEIIPSPRWAFSSEKITEEFVKNKIDQLNDLPEGYYMKKLTLEDLSYLDKEMARNAVLTYDTLEELIEKANTFAIFDEEVDKLVSMCTGYPILEGEDEIDILTRDDPKYRRKGFATRVALVSMLDSLQNNRTPVWDAANDVSRKMAAKLGFIEPEKYLCYICKME